MKKFFIDTANIPYIKNLWNDLKNDVHRNLVVGITTNPNAFYKLEKNNLSEWLDHLPRLCEAVSEIRQDDKGIVYVQCPNSNMSNDEIIEYAELVTKYTDGNTKLGLKIAPKQSVLSIVDDINKILETNVTGVADASTALKCMTYNVRYVSVIPGRMEESGIDAKSQIAFINQSGNKDCEIITGSMRTLEQLIWTFQYGTVPTVGERVWDLILKENKLIDLLNIDYNNIVDIEDFSPSITDVNKELSVAFFKQMDDCGKIAHEDYLTKYYF